MSFGISFEDEKTDNRLIWSTKKVDEILEKIEDGIEIKHSPFFDGNINYRKSNLVFEYTDWELGEIEKCARDIIYFANNYCQVMTDDGYQKIQLRDYQETMLINFQNERWNIVLAPRQIGKTICSAIYLTWYLLFNYDKNVMLMANIGKTAREILDKIRAVFEGLPFFLKPGVLRKDVMSMKFDNECRIIGSNTTKTGGISFTIHLLFLDEFAHIEPNIAEEFYGNVYPTLSSSAKSKIIITSTPNGYNLYQRLWQAALDGKNEYFAYKVDWWQVPGRDEDWKRRELANLGSEEEFNKQYGCQFLSSDSILLSSVEMAKLQKSEREFLFQELDDLDDLGIDYSSLKWHPDFDIDTDIDDPNNFFVFSIDLSEGVGGDYSIINIFKVNPIEYKQYKEIVDPSSIYDFFKLTQVGMFRNNVMPIIDVAKILYSLSVEIFDSEQLKLVIEYNAFGSELIRSLLTLYPTKNDFDEEIIVRFKHRIGALNAKQGLKLTPDNKKIYCQALKENIKRNRLEFSDRISVNEASTFSRNRNGSYSAQTGNDDAIMTSVNVCAFFDTSDYTEIIEEFYDVIDEQTKSRINETLKLNDIDGDSFNLYDII